MSNAKARRRARAAIVEFGLRMQDERLAYWTSGNLSDPRARATPTCIAVSPTDVPYDSSSSRTCRSSGWTARSSTAPARPTSELPLHTLLYQRRPEIGGGRPHPQPRGDGDGRARLDAARVPHRARRWRPAAPSPARRTRGPGQRRARGRGRGRARGSRRVLPAPPRAARPRGDAAARVPGRDRHRGRRGRVPARACRRRRRGPAGPRRSHWVAEAWRAQWTGEEIGHARRDAAPLPCAARPQRPSRRRRDDRHPDPRQGRDRRAEIDRLEPPDAAVHRRRVPRRGRRRAVRDREPGDRPADRGGRARAAPADVDARGRGRAAGRRRRSLVAG